MKSAGRSTPVASSEIGSVEVLLQSSASALTCAGDLGEDLVLERRVLEDRLDHQVAPGQVGRVGRRGDAAQQLGLLLLGAAPAGDRLVEEACAVGLALLGALGGDVLEHDLHAGPRADVGDAGAHHPGAEHADLGGAVRRHALGTQLAGVDGLQVEEERLDHVLRLLVDDQVGQVARLDPGRGVEVDLRTLDRRGQDRLLRRVVGALHLLAQQGRERRQELRERRALRAAAGHLVARAVPGVLGALGVVADPRLRRRHEVVEAADELVDETLLLGLRGLEAGALEQHLHQAVLQAEHPDHAGDATAAGQQAQGRLGQPELDRRMVDGDAVVGGQGDLEATAERGAVDRRDDRPREGLEPPQTRPSPPRTARRTRPRRPSWPPPSPGGHRRRRRSSSRW